MPEILQHWWLVPIALLAAGWAAGEYVDRRGGHSFKSALSAVTVAMFFFIAALIIVMAKWLS